ncbi:GNAT family N-acetyltransferase [Anaerococcus porci]|uniref:N-acetyltransferase n=1 Tax=Anaerococcus porci TaxID=2652269 RepID=A0A6N7VSR6_9FIRM|nr:GNAT family N-acetyltransferase [Anaerococcus porci]MDY3006521.1 GNAT family N-acetyltransferase [Anaerococcus porci]MSS77906.1 N-acetyltransferase [Anaerococcus porci]
MEYKINEEEKQVQVFDGNKKIGLIDMIFKGNVIDAVHTGVEKEYGGQGIAGKLVDKLVDYARENNKKIIPSCPYIRDKFEKDDSYDDVYLK